MSMNFFMYFRCNKKKVLPRRDMLDNISVLIVQIIAYPFDFDDSVVCPSILSFQLPLWFLFLYLIISKSRQRKLLYEFDYPVYVFWFTSFHKPLNNLTFKLWNMSVPDKGFFSRNVPGALIYVSNKTYMHMPALLQRKSKQTLRILMFNVICHNISFLSNIV